MNTFQPCDTSRHNLIENMIAPFPWRLFDYTRLFQQVVFDIATGQFPSAVEVNANKFSKPTAVVVSDGFRISVRFQHGIRLDDLLLQRSLKKQKSLDDFSLQRSLKKQKTFQLQFLLINCKIIYWKFRIFLVWNRLQKKISPISKLSNKIVPKISELAS